MSYTTHEDSRSYHFDNAKAILILLVVFGHFIDPLMHDGVFRQLYLFIYTFHMPCFIFISGYFSKKTKLVDALSKYIVPLIVFQVFYVLLNHLLGIANASNSFYGFFTLPIHALWYLLSLFFWNRLLCFINEKNIKSALIVSVFLPLVASYIPLTRFSLSRTLYFCPFFLLGYYFKIRRLEGFLKGKAIGKLLSCLFFVILFYLTVILPIPPGILHGSMPLYKLDLDSETGIVLRYGVIIISLISLFCFLRIMPSRPIFLSHFGLRTLQIYLLHHTVIQLLLAFNIYNYVISYQPSQFLLMLVIIIASLITYWFTSWKVFGEFIGQLIKTGKKAVINPLFK